MNQWGWGSPGCSRAWKRFPGPPRKDPAESGGQCSHVQVVTCFPLNQHLPGTFHRHRLWQRSNSQDSGSTCPASEPHRILPPFLCLSQSRFQNYYNAGNCSSKHLFPRLVWPQEVESERLSTQKTEGPTDRTILGGKGGKHMVAWIGAGTGSITERRGGLKGTRCRKNTEYRKIPRLLRPVWTLLHTDTSPGALMEIWRLGDMDGQVLCLGDTKWSTKIHEILMPDGARPVPAEWGSPAHRGERRRLLLSPPLVPPPLHGPCCMFQSGPESRGGLLKGLDWWEPLFTDTFSHRC